MKQFDTRIQMKRDSATNWTSANPVLLNGEIIVVDTNSGDIRYKVGDGVKTYTQLPFSDESLIASMLSLNGGTMNGNINMNNHKITGLGAPVNPSDAVRQQDLEALSNEIDDIIEGTTAITLPIANEIKLGGVKIGEGINVDGEGVISAKSQLPTGGTPGQLLTKTETGEAWQDGEFLPLSGGTVSGYINFDQANSGIYFSKFQDEHSCYPTIRSTTIDGEVALSIYTNAHNGVDNTVYPIILSGVDTPKTFYDAANKIYVDGELDNFGAEISNELDTKLTTPTGTQGQYLGFTADNVVGAVDGPEGLPSGGTEGQILYQGASGPEWGDKPVMYVNITGTEGNYQSDKTFAEIYEAFQNGGVIFAIYDTLHIPVYLFAGNQMVLFCIYNSSNYISVQIDNQEQVYVGASPISSNEVSFTPASPLTSDNVQDAIEEVYTKTTPTHQTITLSSSAWSSNSQTVTVSGVTADELDQLITPTPAIASQSAYYEAGIMCTNQAENSLTFTCQTVPTSNLIVYVVIQPLG